MIMMQKKLGRLVGEKMIRRKYRYNRPWTCVKPVEVRDDKVADRSDCGE